MSPILSIIVICHEQREELRRCLNSILAMQMPFEYEIIVSDDRSTDGTCEMLEKEYADKVIATYCNSDEGNCANNSQRSGYNRCHAYPLAKGKYIAHVDADDYFRKDADVYVKQVAALEAHPECALAMSNCLVARTDDIENAQPWPFPRKITDGEIIDAEEFLSKNYFRLNQCFMLRRNPDVDPVALYGNRYVDAVITYHHLQFGDIVFVDACDYVYVKNEGSITEVLAHHHLDREVLWNMGIYIPVMMPVWTRLMYMGSYYQMIRDNIKLARGGYKLQTENYESLRELHVWIYDCFARPLTWCDKARLFVTDKWMVMMRKTGWQNNFSIRVLNLLLTY